MTSMLHHDRRRAIFFGERVKRLNHEKRVAARLRMQLPRKRCRVIDVARSRR
jgi:hypothetical protein